MATCRPRLLITVATSVRALSSPRASSSAASIAITASPSTSSPCSSTKIARSASPSSATPTRAAHAHGFGQRLGMKGPAALVDVIAVGGDPERHHAGPELLEHLGGDLVGGPV